MANINKVVFGGETLIDLTGDTVSTSSLLSGTTAHDASGTVITGACTYDSDTSGDTATVAEILTGKTAHARGALLTGTMPNNGAVTGTISTKAGKYTVPQGYHDGSGKVSISSSEQAKIIPANIRKGVSILGVAGNMSGSEDETPEAGKEVIPTKNDQTIIPSSGYTCFREITVKAIPYATSANSAGGLTATIA